MTLLFPILLLAAAAICWPALRLSRKRGPESRWLLFLAGPGVVVWLALTMSGYGAQSLSNVVEVLWLVAGGVVLAYAKVLMIDRLLPGRRGTVYLLMLVLVVAAVVLRALMPILPE